MGILKINNSKPGVRRPLRVEDIQNVWDGLAEALATYGAASSTPKIICGFEIAGLGYGPGVIAFRGKLYVSSSNITIGQTLYGDLAPSNDIRTLSDGTQIDFSAKYVVTTTATATSVVIGTAGAANIAAWKAPYIPPNYVTGLMLATGAVGPTTIAKGVVDDSILTPTLAACYTAGTVSISVDTTNTINVNNYITRPASAAGVYNIPIFSLTSRNVSGTVDVNVKLDPGAASAPRFVPIVLLNPTDGPDFQITFTSNGHSYIQPSRILGQGGRGCFTVCKISQVEYIPCGAMVVA